MSEQQTIDVAGDVQQIEIQDGSGRVLRVGATIRAKGQHRKAQQRTIARIVRSDDGVHLHFEGGGRRSSLASVARDYELPVDARRAEDDAGGAIPDRNMTMREYQGLAARTCGQADWRDAILMACLGLAGEVGEFVDLIKKQRFHGHGEDVLKLGNELGDVLWYVAAAATALGFDLGAVAENNINKLRKRYPEGFSSEASQRRADVGGQR